MHKREYRDARHGQWPWALNHHTLIAVSWGVQTDETDVAPCRRECRVHANSHDSLWRGHWQKTWFCCFENPRRFCRARVCTSIRDHSAHVQSVTRQRTLLPLISCRFPRVSGVCNSVCICIPTHIIPHHPSNRSRRLTQQPTQRLQDRCGIRPTVYSGVRHTTQSVHNPSRQTDGSICE